MKPDLHTDKGGWRSCSECEKVATALREIATFSMREAVKMC